MEEKQSYVAALSFLNLPGRVNLKKPDVPIWMCFNFIGPESSPAHISDEAVESTLLDTYIGRLLAVGGMLEELKKYDLKRRFYLGPTSLDHALALLMANAAQVQRGGVVLDPFVGTASILVGASHFGGFCNGFDIDMRVLKGNMHAGIRTGAVNKHAEESNPNDGEGGGHSIPEGGRGTGGKGQRREKKKQKTIDMQRSIWENFRCEYCSSAWLVEVMDCGATDVIGMLRRYNLPLPEIIRMDNHLFD
ncbi:TRMT11, partial [Symbiodinium microadriaticum]